MDKNFSRVLKPYNLLLPSPSCMLQIVHLLIVIVYLFNIA